MHSRQIFISRYTGLVSAAALLSPSLCTACCSGGGLFPLRGHKRNTHTHMVIRRWRGGGKGRVAMCKQKKRGTCVEAGIGVGGGRYPTNHGTSRQRMKKNKQTNERTLFDEGPDEPSPKVELPETPSPSSSPAPRFPRPGSMPSESTFLFCLPRPVLSAHEGSEQKKH